MIYIDDFNMIWVLLTLLLLLLLEDWFVCYVVDYAILMIVYDMIMIWVIWFTLLTCMKKKTKNICIHTQKEGNNRNNNSLQFQLLKYRVFTLLIDVVGTTLWQKNQTHYLLFHGCIVYGQMSWCSPFLPMELYKPHTLQQSFLRKE